MAKSRIEMIGAWIALFVPIAGTISAIALAFYYGYVRSQDLWLMLGMYIATALGITVGYHRMLTHQSFRPTAPVKFLFLMLGSMALQGPALFWASVHWKHHAHSDQAEDPHSPWWWKGIDLRAYTAGFWKKVWLRILGFWHGHMGWLFTSQVQWDEVDSIQRKLRQDRLVMFMTRTFVVWVLLRFGICYLIGGFSGMLWGGCVCVLLSQQVTYLVNSATHIFGRRDFETNDESRNNWFVALLAMGEGWHNNHHKFMWSARHGLKWWQLDLSYFVIWLLGKLRLVSGVRVPKPAQMRGQLGAEARALD